MECEWPWQEFLRRIDGRWFTLLVVTTMFLIHHLFAMVMRDQISVFMKCSMLQLSRGSRLRLRRSFRSIQRRDCSRMHALKHQKQVFATGYMLKCCVDTHRLFVGFLSIDAFVTMASWPLIPRQGSANLLETV
jgi:hypothetical protein